MTSTADDGPPDRTQDSGATWPIGRVEVVKLVENTVPLPAQVLLPDLTEDHIEPHRPWIDPYFAPPKDGDLRLRLSLHSFVIRSGGKTIVVDTCVGPDPDRSLPGDARFLDRMEAGIDGGLAAVDVVVCTHVHFDHVGWNAVVPDGSADGRPVPTFPNARYLLTEAELAEVEGNDHMGVLEPSIRPLLDAGVVDVIDFGDDHRLGAAAFAITEEVRLIPTPGHTTGHVSVEIESDGYRALITGDAFHSPVQIAHPEVSATEFDTDSAQSSTTRRWLLERYGDGETLLLGTHFAQPSGGVVRRDDAGHHRFEAIERDEPNGPTGAEEQIRLAERPGRRNG